MSSLSSRPDDPVVGEPEPHESAVAHVTGTAQYTDDIAETRPDALTAWPVQAPHAHARVRGIDVDAALAVEGVVHVLTAADVPGTNDSNIHADEPLFPSEVCYYGQAVCWVLAETAEAGRLGAEAIAIDYEPLTSLVSIAEAIEVDSFQGPVRHNRRGDADAALAKAAHVFSGENVIGGQEHFYLETQAAFAYTDESGQIFIQSSTQNPTETQEIAAAVLGLSSNEVTVQCIRMGGGFGGKETYPHGLAALAALGTAVTGRPVRLRLTRNQDITMSGKRHEFHIVWEAGFDDDGTILALKTTLTADGGFSLDLSEPVVARALCHLDNAYFIDNVDAIGRIAKTNRTTQTAFRGFGGPQGAFVIENVFGRCAPLLGIEPDELRRRNFYRPGQSTPYGQPVRHADRLETVWQQVRNDSDYAARTVQIEAFNREHPDVKRALALTPVKFGISFNVAAFNQAGALVLVYKDGSVLINHGGTEMGQGLHTKMLQVAATALGVRRETARLAPTRTDKVPNASATSASTGSDLNGGAVKDACEQIKARLATVAGSMLEINSADVRFAHGKVYGLGRFDAALDFADVVQEAYSQRVQLSAAGFYRTEGLHWDSQAWQGSPFKYFAYGAAAAEVEIDRFTGSYRTLKVDIVHDVGESLSPVVDIGQIEGAFAQGVGWLTQEDLRWDTSEGPQRGRLLTQAASTYKLPSFSELPGQFNVTLLERAHEDGVVYGSKAVGEPPFLLSFAVREAIRQAVGEFGPPGYSVDLPSPATPESVFWALAAARDAAAKPAPVPA